MKKISALIPAFTILFVLAGCSSSGNIETFQKKSAEIQPNSVVSLHVETITANSSSSRVVEMLSDTLHGRLVSRNVFSSVVRPSQFADYSLDVKLHDSNEVSQGARIILGVFAGSNSLSADVTLRDLRTRQVVSSFRVSGESAAHPLSSENGMEDAVREATSKIVEELRS